MPNKATCRHNARQAHINFEEMCQKLDSLRSRLKNMDEARHEESLSYSPQYHEQRVQEAEEINRGIQATLSDYRERIKDLTSHTEEKILAVQEEISDFTEKWNINQKMIVEYEGLRRKNSKGYCHQKHRRLTNEGLAIAAQLKDARNRYSELLCSVTQEAEVITPPKPTSIPCPGFPSCCCPNHILGKVGSCGPCS